MERLAMSKLFHLSFLVLLTSLESAQQAVEPSHNSTLDVGRVAFRRKRFIGFPKGRSYLVKYNIKTNVVPYTSLFAFAMGFQARWEIVPSNILHSMKRISQKEDTIGQGSPQWSQNDYQSTDYAATQHQRAIHNTLQRGFELHGFNGTACLQRTLCEVSLIDHDDVISLIFKTVFNGTEEFNCSEDLPCPFSFIDFVDHILGENLGLQT